jgi:hypothetical protein
LVFGRRVIFVSDYPALLYFLLPFWGVFFWAFSLFDPS